MFGIRDDELYLRWVQYGVFSPINRLHSSNSDLSGKEPWSYRADVDHFATEALKFRHKLIPYIYTMNYKTHTVGRAICEPMYYAYPDEKDAFKVKINICSEANLWCVRLSAVSTKTRVRRPSKRGFRTADGRIFSRDRFITAKNS